MFVYMRRDFQFMRWFCSFMRYEFCRTVPFLKFMRPFRAVYALYFKNPLAQLNKWV